MFSNFKKDKVVRPTVTMIRKIKHLCAYGTVGLCPLWAHCTCASRESKARCSLFPKISKTNVEIGQQDIFSKLILIVSN